MREFHRNGPERVPSNSLKRVRAFFPFLFLAVYLRAAEPIRIAAPAPVTAATTRVEIVRLDAGAELITFFRNDLPQFTILDDVIGNAGPDAHQFRQIWSYSYVRPNLKQKLAAAIPFFYHRAGRNEGPKNGIPAPILDISDPAKGTLGRLAQWIAQIDIFDSYGAMVRAPTRSYRGNTSDYRDMHLQRVLEVLEAGLRPGALPADLRDEDWDEVRGRLALGQKLLGGYVSDERAEAIARANETEDAENRGSNWDFLRQLAEQNGLYIEPLVAGVGAPEQAVLWFANDASVPEPAKFDSSFLHIANPWNDPDLRKWNKYKCTWHLDNDGVRVDEGTPGAKATAMIPLAIYSLDYPGVPLLLIDFRSARAERREVLRRATDEIATGVFGMTPYSSASWFAFRQTYLFVQNRRGHALNRAERLRAYAQLRQTMLEAGESMDPALRALLDTRLNQLQLNPFEQDSKGETALARRQYEGLVGSPEALRRLNRRLDRDRAKELYNSTHSAAKRTLMQSAHAITFGLVKPRGSLTETQLEALNRHRRLTAAMAVLRQADDLPHPPPAWESTRILAAANELEILGDPTSENTNLILRIRAKVRPAPSAGALAPAAIAGAGE